MHSSQPLCVEFHLCPRARWSCSMRMCRCSLRCLMLSGSTCTSCSSRLLASCTCEKSPSQPHMLQPPSCQLNISEVTPVNLTLRCSISASYITARPYTCHIDRHAALEEHHSCLLWEGGQVGLLQGNKIYDRRPTCSEASVRARERRRLEVLCWSASANAAHSPLSHATLRVQTNSGCRDFDILHKRDGYFLLMYWKISRALEPLPMSRCGANNITLMSITESS